MRALTTNRKSSVNRGSYTQQNYPSKGGREKQKLRACVACRPALQGLLETLGLKCKDIRQQLQSTQWHKSTSKGNYRDKYINERL